VSPPKVAAEVVELLPVPVAELEELAALFVVDSSTAWTSLTSCWNGERAALGEGV
jgi:hypothetical protein